MPFVTERSTPLFPFNEFLRMSSKFQTFSIAFDSFLIHFTFELPLKRLDQIFIFEARDFLIALRL